MNAETIKSRALELFEAFSSKVPYKVLKANNSTFQAVTKNPDGTKTEYFATQEEPDEWHISFNELKPNGKRSYAPTGKGDPFRVMSFVLAATEEFLSRYSPAYMIFTADHDGNGDSRSRAYEAMLKRYAAKYGYNFDKIKRSSETEFALTLKENL